MSFLDLDRLTSHGLVAQYVVECRGRGFFLPYSDYSVIEAWLQTVSHVDDLLLVLSDVLPAYYARAQASGSPPPALSGVQKRVAARLHDQKMRRLSAD